MFIYPCSIHPWPDVHACTFHSLRSNAERLQELVPSATVVKGFNLLSAYLLETGGIQGSKEVMYRDTIQSRGVPARFSLKHFSCRFVIPFLIKKNLFYFLYQY